MNYGLHRKLFQPIYIYMCVCVCVCVCYCMLLCPKHNKSRRWVQSVYLQQTAHDYTITNLTCKVQVMKTFGQREEISRAVTH